MNPRATAWLRYLLLALGTVLTGASEAVAQKADDFDKFVKPLFTKNCIHCHGKRETEGDVNLESMATAKHLLDNPQLIADIIEVIDASDMPPEDEPGLSEAERSRLLTSLKRMLRKSAAEQKPARLPLRRLNRFQYNNSVKDLFRLAKDIFALPEKLMTRHQPYLTSKAKKMPHRVEVECLSLRGGTGLSEVDTYPKDLRAAHGYDNQANQLSLSPLLLDSFLRLSVSIVESPDFHQATVGIWDEFFAAPPGGSPLESTIRARLGPFLRLAFRGPVDDATLDRYTTYAATKIGLGLPFVEGMKKVAAAALSSPMFLYRRGSQDGPESPFQLASKLSFFLWGSSPDSELLRLAKDGELARPAVLSKTLARMLADPKIERFLDSFPSQWMQLENVLAATPDPGIYRLFDLDNADPVSLQMVLEPLLLFDAVFIENRPIVELIAPAFGYRSRFLRTWYESDLKPARVDESQLAAQNKAKQARIDEFKSALQRIRSELAALDQALPTLIDEQSKAIDLAPGQAQWEAAQGQLLAASVTLSAWSAIGPFNAANFDEAHAKSFITEAAVALSDTHGDRSWKTAPKFVDGKPHQLKGSNCATYLYRTIQSSTARPLDISLGSDDSFRIWLNGKLIAEKKVSRGLQPDQEQLRLELIEGENTLLMKIVNGGGGYGFYFRPQAKSLPGPVLTALHVKADEQSVEQKAVLASYYRTFAPELAPVRVMHAERKAALKHSLQAAELGLKKAPKPRTLGNVQAEAQRRLDNDIRNQLRSRTFERVAASDPRYGGVITNAAMMSMTSGPKRTHPIARGAWILEVIFNDPPSPPPQDFPPLEETNSESMTIRERFAEHRKNPSCASCHSKLDPLGFALENFDITGRWRDIYPNGRKVDATGTMLRSHEFAGIVQFKASLVKEKRRFAKAFTAHLLRFALSRDLVPFDTITIDKIVDKLEGEDFKLQSIIREVVSSDSFLR